MTPEEYEAPTTIASLYSVLLELFSQRRWLLPLPLTQPFTTYSFDYLIFAWSKTCSYIPSRLVDVQGANVMCLLTLVVTVHCNYEHTPMAAMQSSRTGSHLLSVFRSINFLCFTYCTIFLAKT